MQSYYTFLALDLAEERTREADRYRLAAAARAGQPESDRSFRHRTALLLASISRGSAAVVRRLDECVADDLAESFGSETFAHGH
jgi:hypothetical protein